MILKLFGKPVFLICKDFEEYKSKERRLLIEFEKVPFMLAKSEEELFNNIEQFDIKEYKNKCKLFDESIGLISSKGSSKKIVEIIKNQMENN